MPARKAGKKGAAKSASKARKLAATPTLTTSALLAKIKRREWVMYGIPIFDVAATGNVAEMRRVAQAARTHLEDVQRSLGQLDAALRQK